MNLKWLVHIDSKSSSFVLQVIANTPPEVNVTFNTNCEGGTMLGPNHCANVQLGIRKLYIDFEL